MKVGARNRIVGKVTEIDKGKIMCFVKLPRLGNLWVSSGLSLEFD